MNCYILETPEQIFHYTNYKNVYERIFLILIKNNVNIMDKDEIKDFIINNIKVIKYDKNNIKTNENIHTVYRCFKVYYKSDLKQYFNMILNINCSESININKNDEIKETVKEIIPDKIQDNLQSVS